MGFKDTLMTQLGNPHGFWTPFMSLFFNRGNRSLIENAIDAACLQPGQTALDIGFGGGVSLKLLTERVGEDGFVFGCDPSQDIVSRAKRKHAKLVTSGRLVVLDGAAEALGIDDDSIDGGISCNTFYFWPDLEKGAAEIVRVLKPGACMVLGNRTVEKLKEFGFTDETHNLMSDQEIKDLFTGAGAGLVDVLPVEDRWASTLYCIRK